MSTDKLESGAAFVSSLSTFVEQKIENARSKPEPLSKDQRDAVRNEIERRLENAASLTEPQVQQVIGLIEEFNDADGDSGGSGGGAIDSRTQAEINTSLLKMGVSGMPTHVSKIRTGTPAGNYHAHGDWGNVLVVQEPVHWRQATVDAETGGMTRLRVREMEFEEGETYELGDIYATRELDHGSGPQTIRPDITFLPGVYFIDRDPDAVQPMRRVETDVNFDEFNDSHQIPVEIRNSWRGIDAYKPDGSDFEKYRSNGWDSRLFYFGDLEFGYGHRVDAGGGES